MSEESELLPVYSRANKENVAKELGRVRHGSSMGGYGKRIISRHCFSLTSKSKRFLLECCEQFGITLGGLAARRMLQGSQVTRTRRAEETPHCAHFCKSMLWMSLYWVPPGPLRTLSYLVTVLA